MSLAKVNELLQHAAKNHYGVAAVNVINVETVRYIIEEIGRASCRERV